MNIIQTDLKWNGNLSNRSRTDYIALHHAEASKCTVEDVHRWHRDGNGWSGIGYHFFVRKDGTIYEGRPLNTMGAHVSGKNNCSIGICAEGNYMSETMPVEQKKAICELLVSLKLLYPSAKIVGHGEIGDSNCPGNNFPLADIKANYKVIATPCIEEYTDSNDIIWELNHRGIISDSDLWLDRCKKDDNIYWFCRKVCHYIRTKTRKETEKDMYKFLHDIAWDLEYRGVITNSKLWEEQMKNDKNTFYLLQKSLHYCRTH